MGLTPRGQGARAIKEGWTQKDGKLPVNPSGGLKAKGHPIGATGVSMHVMSAMQLVGQAPEGMQLKNPKTRRHLQHGWRRGGELRLGAGAGEVAACGQMACAQGAAIAQGGACAVPITTDVSAG